MVIIGKYANAIECREKRARFLMTFSKQFRTARFTDTFPKSKLDEILKSVN